MAVLGSLAGLTATWHGNKSIDICQNPLVKKMLKPFFFQFSREKIPIFTKVMCLLSCFLLRLEIIHEFCLVTSSSRTSLNRVHERTKENKIILNYITTGVYVKALHFEHFR